MSKIQEIFQTYGPEYVKRYGNNMPSAHRKAIAAIVNCRTGELGMHEYACPSCGTSMVHRALLSAGFIHTG